MFKYFLMTFLLLCSSAFTQTYEWVNLVSPDYQFNPSYLHVPSSIDNSGNPVCARLINFREGYNLRTYGDVKIEKRNPSGSLIWENTIYGKADVSEMVFDSQDNIICIGTYRDTMQIDTGQLINPGSGTANFLLKLNSTGNLAWLKAGTEFPQNGVPTALEIKAPDDFLVGVTNYSTNANIYVFNPAGNLVSTIEQQEVTTISDINEDKSGNIWAAGFVFNGQISFNGLDTIAPFTYNEYVVKYNSSGTAQWVNFIEDITVQDYNIETDISGNAYLSGNLFAPTQFGNLTANGPQWVYDYFVTKIDPDGNYLWLNEIPPGNTLGDATIGNSNFLSCSDNGDTYITGFCRGEINFGNGVIIQPIDYNDIFVISYDQDGIVKWAKAAGGTNYDQGCGIITDNNGSCYVSGAVSQNAVFDTISTAGEYMNLFLAKLTFDTPVSVENELTGNAAKDYLLMQNYPNPFNPVTKIKYTIPSVTLSEVEGSFVTLKVYDILGNEVTTLVNEEKSAGTYEVSFDASNLPAGRQGLTSGIYFYKLTSKGLSETKKMILLR